MLSHCHLINTANDSDGGLDDYSSLHPGGANMVYADGSVHYIKTVASDNPDGSYTSDSLVLQTLGNAQHAGDNVPTTAIE